MRFRDITLDYEILVDIINSNEFRVRQLGGCFFSVVPMQGVVIRCARVWLLDGSILEQALLYIIFKILYVTTNIIIIYIKYVIQCLNVMWQALAGIYQKKLKTNQDNSQYVLVFCGI